MRPVFAWSAAPHPLTVNRWQLRIRDKWPWRSRGKQIVWNAYIKPQNTPSCCTNLAQTASVSQLALSLLRYFVEFLGLQETKR
jgi:hypothetical protein